MSDFIHSTPDRPITWTLASESQIKKLPSLEQMWAEWREGKTWEASGVVPSIDKVNAYHELELLKEGKR